MESKVTGPAIRTETPDVAYINAASRWRSVKLNPDLVTLGRVGVSDTLSINLFDEVVYAATVDRVATNINGTVTARARIVGYDFGYVLISTTRGSSWGSIHVPEKGQYYHIQSVPKDDIHILLEMDADRIDKIRSGPPIIPPPPKDDDPEILRIERKVREMGLGPMDHARVDVMVVYTANARSWAGGSTAIANVIAQAMEKGQLTLDNSATHMEINLVHTAEVNYRESREDASTNLNRLQNTEDGHMEEVHAWRDEYGADLVALFAEIDDVGGMAFLLRNRSGNPEYGFSLTRVQQAGWTYTHIHELGHNMGLHHHKNQTVQPGPTVWWDWSANTWSAGWRWTGTDNKRYCSVMTYGQGEYHPDGHDHTEVAHISNPSVQHQGVPSGHSADGDNARTLREIKHVIAAYHDTVPGPVGVQPSDPGVADITVLPGYPSLRELAGTEGGMLNSESFRVEYDLEEHHADWQGVYLSRSGFAPMDLSGSQIIIGAKGDPDAIAVEFEHFGGGRTIIHLNGVSGERQHWHIDASLIDHVNDIKAICFVVNGRLISPGDDPGEFTVYIDGLYYTPPPMDVSPSDPGVADITVLPGYPSLRELAGTEGGMMGPESFRVEYDLEEHHADWQGVYVSRDDFTPMDLSGSQIVIGAKGDPDAIAVEFEHSGGKTIIHLNGMTGERQHWHIDASLINNAHVINAICFVVNEGMVSAEADPGEFTVYIGGLYYTPPPMGVEPNDPGVADITILPGYPFLRELAGTEGEMMDPESFRVEYDLGAHHTNWQGVYVSRDDFAVMDLSGPAYTQIVIGVKGDPDVIVVEFECSEDRTIFHLNSVTGERQHWHIDASLIDNAHDIIAICFVVDKELISTGDGPGEFTVFLGGLYCVPTPVPELRAFEVGQASSSARFEGEPGYYYYLEYTTDLIAHTQIWQRVDSDESGTGGTITLQDPNPPDALRFYRIVVSKP